MYPLIPLQLFSLRKELEVAQKKNDILKIQQLSVIAKNLATKLANESKELFCENEILGEDFHKMLLAIQNLIEYLNTRRFGLAKLSVYVEKDLDLILNQFRGLFKNYEVMATSKDYIEITRKGTNKWEAFCHLPVEDAIFIGDGENDLCILEKLNDTYVMEHAPESLKAYGVCVKSVAEAMNIESRKENV